MAFPLGEHLPRLTRHHYQGHAAVHWEGTLAHRATGWLDGAFHARFRELLLHAAAREALVCPVYCLMPDHYHLVWLGLRRTSDQLNGMKFLREFVNAELAAAWERKGRPGGAASAEVAADVSRWQGAPGPKKTSGHGLTSAATSAASAPRVNAKPWRLQKQAFDRVIRPEERRRGMFQANCDYIRLNPVRAGLVEREADWPFAGCVVPGYPDLHPARAESWAILWQVVGAAHESEPAPTGKPGLHDGKGAPWLT
jgi:REP element-mobilizing transposase RayT